MSSRGNEYFCEIDEDYLTDRFNLTGLNADVENYQHAIDLINDVFDADCDDETRERIEKSARHLYGLIHARYITTTRGLQKMVSPPHLSSRHQSSHLPYTLSLTFPHYIPVLSHMCSSKNTKSLTSAGAPACTAPPIPSSPQH